MELLSSTQEDVALSDKCELNEKYFHKSHKGKKVSGVESKRKGTPAGKMGIGDELICSLIGVFCGGKAFAEVHSMRSLPRMMSTTLHDTSTTGHSSGSTKPNVMTGL